MAAAAHDAAFARKAGVPQSVAREFIEADKRAVVKAMSPTTARRAGRRS
jgi:hypothetical protein